MAESFQQSDEQEDDDPSPAPADAQTGQADNALMAMLAGNDIDRILAEQEATLTGDVPSVDASAIPEPVGTLATANENATLLAGQAMESSAESPADIDMVIEEDEPLACDEDEKDLQMGDDLLQKVSAMADAESKRDADFAASAAHAAALDQAQPGEVNAGEGPTLSDVEMRALHMQIETGSQSGSAQAEVPPEPEPQAQEPAAEVQSPAATPPSGEYQVKHRPADEEDAPVMTLQELDDLLTKQAGGKAEPKPLAPLDAQAPTPAPKVPVEELAAAIQRQAPEAANPPADDAPATDAPPAETDDSASPAQPSLILASVCRTLEVINRPFNRLPLRARKVVGLIGAQLLLAGIAMLFFCLLRR